MKAVNLLPPDLRGAPRRIGKGSGAPAPEAPGGSGPFVVLGALVLCVIGLAGFVLANNTIKDREAQLGVVTAEHTAAQAKALELKPYGDFQDMALRRIETVKGLASLRFDWEQALRDVSYATPASVTLSSLNGTVAAGQGGGSSNPLRAAISAPAIELKGCTRSQPAVARLMSRLRTVRGVTRVSLSKSDKESGASAVGATAGPCGVKNAPSFEMVVFFERAVSQAAAANITATAATTAPASSTQTAAPTQPAAQTTGATTAP